MASKNPQPAEQNQTGEKKGKRDTHQKRASAAGLIDAFANQYAADREENKTRERHRIFREWLTIVGLFLAAAVAYFQWRELKSTDHHIAEQAKIAGNQFKAMGDANIAAVKALHQSQRPWVVVEKVELIAPIKYDKGGFEFSFDLTLKNTGSSVATSVFTVARLEANLATDMEMNWNKTDGDLANWKKIFAESSKWPMGIVLAPSQMVNQPFGFGGPYKGSPSTEAVKLGTFYILGLIEYVDQFGITHRTRFAFNPRADSVTPWDGKTFLVSGGMQEAD